MSFWRDQVVLVTGASRGIGKEIALAFAKSGAKVAINYRSNESQAQSVLEQCEPDRAKLFRADVSNESEVKKMFAEIETDLGPVSILINNAGITRDGLLMMMSTKDWRDVMSTHLDGAFFCSREAIKHMLSKKFGRVINISSISGVKGTPGQCNYSAAKAGLIGFSKALAREMGKKNITSNALVLGIIETEMLEALTDDARKNYLKAIPLKRFGTPHEAAQLCLYLAGPDGGYVTGQAVVMDGGFI